MNSIRFAVLGSLLVILLSFGGVLADAPEVPAQSTVSAAFTYQGRLTDGGLPANGEYDFEIRLFDAPSGGAQQGSTVTLNDVQVTGGLFTVTLDFGNSVFQGDARYLDVAVRHGASVGSYELLTPRQAITPAPYAITLKPGAVVTGPVGTGLYVNSTNIDGTGVYGYASAVTGEGSGVVGSVNAPGGNGVLGLANATSGDAVGVEGQSYSSLGVGVLGYARAISGFTRGLSGQVDSPDGTGVFGWAASPSGQTFAVYGQADSPSGTGVYGDATASTGTNYGVYGRSASTGGTGVYGAATAGTGTNYGIYGAASSSSGFGVYGTNSAGAAVAGYSSTGSGVYGNSTGGAGVSGYSNTGPGVVGSTTSGFAMQAFGDAQQSPANGGWVKAMILVNPPQIPPIIGCFNSTASGSTISTPPCGFSVTINSTGVYTIDFGFTIYGRFFSVTPRYGAPVTAQIAWVSSTQMGIEVFDQDSDPEGSAEVYVIVF